MSCVPVIQSVTVPNPRAEVICFPKGPQRRYPPLWRRGFCALLNLKELCPEHSLPGTIRVV